MKLSAIEAIKYGALEGACLSELGDGLTVVLGPNESGKSTLTALTRHVLYGFPTKKAKNDRGYHPSAGTRAARLVFSDPSGEWAIERVDGPKGGPVSVIRRSGDERHELLRELTTGVTEQSFRVVFGFGVDELDMIETSGASDIMGRLYAAGSGLSVNPMDVRQTLQAAAAGLYAVRGKNQTINQLVSGMKQARESMRTLEAEALAFTSDQARLGEMRERLEPLRREREALELSVNTLARDVERAEEATSRLAEGAARERELSREIEAAERRISELKIDERVLEAGSALGSVLEDASGFKAHVQAAGNARAEAMRLSEQIHAEKRFGSEANDSPETRVAVERWRDRLSAAQSRAENAVQAAKQARVRADAVADVVGQQAPPAVQSSDKLTGIGVLVLGVVAMVVGAFTGQSVAAVVGLLVAGVGVIVLMRKPAVRESSLSDDAVRARAEAKAAEDIAATAAKEHDDALADWRAWLAEQNLDTYGADPVAVRQLLDDIAEHRRSISEAERLEKQALAEERAAMSWVERLADVIKSLDPQAVAPSIASALEVAADARQRFEAMKQAKNHADGLASELTRLRSELSALTEEADRVRGDLERSATARGVDVADPVPGLVTLRDAAREDLTQVRDECDSLAREVGRLEGSLNDESRSDELTRAHQRIEGLRADAALAAESYVVNSLAVKLLDSTRERYERERQPEVVRIAARVFSQMTEGRYRDVLVPIDAAGSGGTITVIAENGSARGTDSLSKGTVEQLYLALRVGLIASVEDVGRSLPILMDDVLVNFDPARRNGAAKAVAELASSRQVLFFTCHPQTAETLIEAVPGATVKEMDRCAFI